LSEMLAPNTRVHGNGEFLINEGALVSWARGAATGGPEYLAPAVITIGPNGVWRVRRGEGGGGTFTCTATVNVHGLMRGNTADTSSSVTFEGPVNLFPGYTISPNGGSVVMAFAGPVGGNVDFLRNNAGIVAFAGNNTYTGNTVISAGTLALVNSGSITNSPIIDLTGGILDVSGLTNAGGFTLVSGQTLRGTSTVTGATTVGAGATLSPGSAGAGTLTINGDLTLAGNTEVDVDSAGVSDQVAGTGARAFGGTLTVNNLGPVLTTNDTFALFTSGGTGNFAAFVPANPNNDTALAWSFDSATGVLSVVPGTTVPTPEPLVVTNQGNTNLVFTWTQSGWKLQSQTNALGVGLSTNWSDVPGGTTPPVNVPMDAANPAVFFRLKNQ